MSISGKNKYKNANFKEGLSYDRGTIKATLQKDKMIVKEWTLDGPTMEILAQGEIDLAGRKISLTLLVAPLKTVDRITKLIPLVSYIFAGTLVTIPVKVQGDLKDPRVTPLSPSAVGAELLAMMRGREDKEWAFSFHIYCRIKIRRRFRWRSQWPPP